MPLIRMPAWPVVLAESPGWRCRETNHFGTVHGPIPIARSASAQQTLSRRPTSPPKKLNPAEQKSAETSSVSVAGSGRGR